MSAHADLITDLFDRGPLNHEQLRLITEQLTDTLATADDPTARALLGYCLWCAISPGDGATYGAHPRNVARERLSRRRLNWTPTEVAWLIDQNGVVRPTWILSGRASVGLTAAERLSADQLADVQRPLRDLAAQLRIRDWPVYGDSSRDAAALLRRVAALLSRIDQGTLPVDLLVPDDPFGLAARAAVLAVVDDEAEAAMILGHLVEHGEKVTPTAAWRTSDRRFGVEHPRTAEVSRRLLDVLREQPEPVLADANGYVLVRASDTPLVRGAVSAVAGLDQPGVVELLGAVALLCGVGFGGRGGQARSGGIANTTIAALAERAVTHPADVVPIVAQLSRLQQKVANKPLRTSIGTALERAAGSAGLTTGQLVERSVPDLGLDQNGRLEVAVGDHTALLQLTGHAAAAKLEVTWRTPAGAVHTSVPASVKTDHATELAAVRSTVKQAKQLVAAQRQRLEDLLAVERTWVGVDWVRDYAEQPLVGLSARSLLWQVRDPGDDWHTGLPEATADGWILRDHDDRCEPVTADRELRLWHPVGQRLPDVRAWRARLTDAGLGQPFKQVFRESYLLTPAEESTGTYSNRFAAHILRYPQAGALMRTRGWSATHLGFWDGGFDGQANKEVGEDGWRAVFWYQLVERDDEDHENVSLCSTDQVRFERREGNGRNAGWTVRPLVEVPALVFSEAMRDVDLFVGVTSVGADPAWSDRGTERFGAYWQRSSFGELSESAEIRRDALARLLPRTKLAGRYELDGKFLLVHGRIRDYKIHLGSSNILMGPADTYLCIVPAQGDRGPKVHLPFEQDGGRLSLIVSKAFLLADDTSITDPTIVSQLRLGLAEAPGSGRAGG